MIKPTLMVATVIMIAGCAGTAPIDPLAPVPTRVDPDDIATPQLRQAWAVTRTTDADEIEVPTHAAAVGDHLVFVAYPGRVEALDLQGDTQWSMQPPNALAHRPIALNGGVALASESGWLWVDATGATRARIELGAVINDVVVVPQGLVVIGDELVYLLALDSSDDLVAPWQQAFSGGRRASADPDGESVFISNADGSLSCINASTGVVRWRSTEVEVAPLRPAVGKAVYVVSQSGRVYSIRARDGKRRWAGKDVGMRVTASPVVVDGLVWVPGMDAAAHAFTAAAGSHQFRVPGNGRIYLDLAIWGPWVIVSPQYGPWVILEGPRNRTGPANPGNPTVLNIASSDDIPVPPGVGAVGVVVIDAAGTVRLLTPQRGAGESP